MTMRLIFKLKTKETTAKDIIQHYSTEVGGVYELGK